MTCGIYQILNTFTGKCYVGKSVGIESRWNDHKKSLIRNSHWNIKLQNSWNKYGPDVWEWTILQIADKEKLFYLEALWMARLCSIDSGYNIRKITLEGTEYFSWSRSFSIEHRRKLSLANSVRIYTEIWKKRIGDAHRGMKHTEEAKAKIREKRAKQVITDIARKKISFAAKNISPETRDKMSKAQKNKSQETLKKLSDAGKNRIFTPETRKKISDSNLGHRHSDEARAKIKEKRAKQIITEEHKAKLRGLAKSPETLKKLSESAKAYWAKKKLEAV